MTDWKTLVLAHLDKKINHFQSLDDHLNHTTSIMLESLSAAVHFDVLSSGDLHTLVSAIGKFHDLGKFTDFFQSYIKYGKNLGDLKNHAHVSALALYRYLQLSHPFTCDPKEREVLLFLVYLVVRLHHNHLATDGLFLKSNVLAMMTVLQKQTAQLNNKADEMAKFYGVNPQQMIQLLDVAPVLQNRSLTLMKEKLQDRRKHERWYFILLYLFSLLIDSDKLDSAQLGKRSLAQLSPELVSEYLNKKHGDDLGNDHDSGVTDQREEARRSIISVVNSLTEEQLRDCRLYTLTAPTGIGKTLSSLQAALVLREKLKPLLGRYPRIITAIPFINILQGAEKDYRGTLDKNAHVIVHHQNADFFASEPTEDLPLDKKLLEVESWEGDVILTTFVQLFQSLITGNKRRLKKLNKLAGSIVILDEVQSIPEKYMPLIGACLIKLGEYYGTRFILMTATQPKIIELGIRLLRESRSCMPKEHYLQRIELLPDHTRYFQSLHRTKIIPVLDRKMDVPDFIDFFLDTWEQRSSVIVVNTIRQSLELYEALAELDLEDTAIRYLSTNLMPTHRRAVIDEVWKMLESGQRVILVSTQTIEAGVDLDFDIGYRALAPLEAIVQTAGRVNRKGKKMDREGRPMVCPVYVIELGKGHYYVYDLNHLDRTGRFLSAYAHDGIEEREYQSMIESYYAELFKHPIADESRTIWEQGIMTLNFDMIEQFQMIENPGEVADVFVEWNDEATRLADSYAELKVSKACYNLEVFRNIIPDAELDRLDPELSFHQRKALLKFILSKMGNYMVQVRYKRLQKNRPLLFEHRKLNGVEAPFYWIPREDLNRYYSPETGFKDESGEAYIL